MLYLAIFYRPPPSRFIIYIHQQSDCMMISIAHDDAFKYLKIKL